MSAQLVLLTFVWLRKLGWGNHWGGDWLQERRQSTLWTIRATARTTRDTEGTRRGLCAAIAPHTMPDEVAILAFFLF